jgi:vitamin B12 transporter
MRRNAQFQFESPETGLAARIQTQPMRACMERSIKMMKMNRASRVALAVVAVCASGSALAQDDLDETVVTATRTPVPIDSVGAPVIVITRSDIERSLASDVSEILQQYAGLEIARNGGPGQTTSLFTRGTESNHTVVLVDGVRINPGTIGGAALQNIAPESLERIEIVKGPGSSLYGTDAIGGVIQVFTRGADKDGISTGASYGSHATQQLFGDAAFSAGKVKFGVGGGYEESDGIPTYDFSTDDRGYRNVTGRAMLQVDATDALAFRARAWRAAGRTEYSDQDFFAFPPADIPVSQDFENSVYSVEGDYRGADGLGIRGTLSTTRDYVDQNDPNFLGDLDFAHTRRTTLDVQADLPTAGDHQLSVGVQHSAENTDALSFGTAFDEDTAVTQGFVQDQFSHDWFNARAAVGYVDHETFGGEFTWNAELGAALAGGTRIALLGGKAFRAPDSTDRFGFGGNPDLKPEISQQLELSLRQKLGEHHQLSLSIFDNQIDDLINYVVTDPLTFDGHNENVDHARIKGGELGYRFTGQAWQLRANLVMQDPRDETTDERLLRRARESVTFAVNRDVGALDVGLDAQYYGNRKDFGDVTLDPYTLVNASVRYRVTSALTLQARIENAFDEDYTLAAGYFTEGRTYTMGVRYGFE